MATVSTLRGILRADALAPWMTDIIEAVRAHLRTKTGVQRNIVENEPTPTTARAFLREIGPEMDPDEMVKTFIRDIDQFVQEVIRPGMWRLVWVEPPTWTAGIGRGGPQLGFCIAFETYSPAPASEDSFADTERTLGELRGDKTQDGAAWSPRDLLVRMLREHDAGSCRLNSLVVAFRAEDGTIGFWNAAPDMTTAMGLAAMLNFSLMAGARPRQ